MEKLAHIIYGQRHAVAAGFILSLTFVLTAAAQVMSSSNYSIDSDSINVGGGNSSSTNYTLEDTAGDIATGYSSSTNYSLHAGYQQMRETYIAMTSASDVTLTPSISGVLGGIATGMTSVVVTTDNSSGYELSIKASSSPALQSGANSFADYAPAGADPDYDFTVAANDSAFGFTPEGDDIAQAYKDDGAACNSGSLDTASKCWNGLSTSNQVIARRTSPNNPSGTQTSIRFRAESGSTNVQANGTYDATTTITVVAL